MKKLMQIIQEQQKIERYILVIGDEVIMNDISKDRITEKYKEALKKYDGRPSLKPSLWKCIKEPK